MWNRLRDPKPDLAGKARQAGGARFAEGGRTIVLLGWLALLGSGGLTGVARAQESSEAAVAQYADAANFQTNGAFDLAIEGWQAFLEKFPQDPLAPKAAHYLGVCYMQRGEPDYAAAAEAFGKALETESYDLREESLANRGWCLYAAANQAEPPDPQALEASIKTFAELSKQHPKSNYLDRAYFYSGEAAYALGKTSTAIRLYERMLQLPEAEASPLRCDALYARGVAQQEAGEAAAAVSSYEQLIEVCDEETLRQDARLRMGDLLLQQKQPEQAEIGRASC